MKKPDANPLEDRVKALRAELASTNPNHLAAVTGAQIKLEPGGLATFELELWRKPVLISFPGFEAVEAVSGQPLRIDSQALLLYYFRTSDGTLPTGRWIAFSELPDGKFYAQAFQGYTGADLARTFGDDPSAFSQAAANLGGRRESLGDLSFSFWPLPRVPLMAVLWRGDEDFPTSAHILFDETIPHHLPTDVAAILAGMLVRKLVGGKK